ncbi:MAG: hypothetical protein ABEH65_04205 [Halobacteriales archaeon]
MGAEAESIAEFADSEKATDLMKEVAEHTLPADLAALVEDYDTLEGSRDPFLWRWIHSLTPEFTLDFVPKEHVSDVRKVKTIATMFITLADDVLEKDRDRATYEEITKIPHPSQSVDFDHEGVRTDYLEFSQRVWSTLETRLNAAPNSHVYMPLFQFDTKQAFDAIEYSYLMSLYPGISTYREIVQHDTHNVMMFSYADIDLMYSPGMETEDLAPLRDAIWHAQLMARIGNWIATWERELTEYDFSSGPVVYALEEGIIDLEDLKELERTRDSAKHDEIVTAIKDADVEDFFLSEWQNQYDELKEASDEIDDFVIADYCEGMEIVLRYFLSARGWI